MNVNERLTRLEDALINLMVVVTEGNLGRLGAHMAQEVMDAGRGLQAFHQAITTERTV
jgi:hypothetical protein